jgi:hypothetical protein
LYNDFVPDLTETNDDSSTSSKTTISEGVDDEYDDDFIKEEETSVLDEEEAPAYHSCYGCCIKSNPKYAATYYFQPPLPSTSSSFPPHQTHQYLAHGLDHQKVFARSLLSSYIQGLQWPSSLDGCHSFDGKHAYAHLLHHYDEDTKTL